MYIEKSMNGEKTLKINIEITEADSEGLYSMYINGEEAVLPMMGGNEADTTTIGDILRCLYDGYYGVDNPRFDTTGEPQIYKPETPHKINAGAYLTLNGFGHVRVAEDMCILPDGTLCKQAENNPVEALRKALFEAEAAARKARNFDAAAKLTCLINDMPPLYPDIEEGFGDD